MRWLGLATFRHGVHPAEAKDGTRALPIRRFPFVSEIVVPLSQHLGKPAIPVVRDGQRVTRGDVIAEPDGFLSVAMHAPATGRVKEIALRPSITGRMAPAVVIETEPGSSQEAPPGEPCDLDTATPDAIVRAVQWAGVVGLGGAGFPTHAKLKLPDGRRVETLIVNGVECEPYLTTDHRVMLEQRDDVYQGIRYLRRATGAERVVVGVEENKPDAAEHLRAGWPDDVPGGVETLRVKYPQGAEKMLITALLGREVPSGGLPLDVGALCVNVATTAEIGRLLPVGRGILERVITVAGPAVERPGNYRIPIGTPVRALLDEIGLRADANRVFLGGPMMGNAVPSLDVVVTKGTSGVVAFSDELAEPTHAHVYPCIRCGYCVDACPIFLDPSELGRLAEQRAFDAMADRHHLMDCFECGSCTWVCPAHIPLVQRFREAKRAVRKAQAA